MILTDFLFQIHLEWTNKHKKIIIVTGETSSFQTFSLFVRHKFVNFVILTTIRLNNAQRKLHFQINMVRCILIYRRNAIKCIFMIRVPAELRTKESLSQRQRFYQYWANFSFEYCSGHFDIVALNYVPW